MSALNAAASDAPSGAHESLPVVDSVGEYEKIKRIGQGTYGVVCERAHCATLPSSLQDAPVQPRFRSQLVLYCTILMQTAGDQSMLSQGE